MDTYNISAILLVCAYLLFAFYCMKKVFPKPAYALLAFLFFLFSTSTMNRLPQTASLPFFPYQLWNTPHLMFDRITTLPHHLLFNILFLYILTFLFTRQRNAMMRIAVVLMMALMTILQPVAGTLLISTYLLTTLTGKEKKEWGKIRTITIGFLLAVLYLGYLYLTDKYVSGMTNEARWQVLTIVSFLLRSIGPILPFGVLGMIFRWKKAIPVERFGMILLSGTYVVFLFPAVSTFLHISNARLLFPAHYLFWGWFAASGLMELAGYLQHVMTIKKRFLIMLLFFIFLISVAPTITWEIQQKIPSETTYQDPLYFLPKTVVPAFTYLADIQPLSTVVLGNPSSHMNMLIPVLSGHKTMIGPRYATMDFERKHADVVSFFTLSMDAPTARTWLQQHHVTYVLYTIYDGYIGNFKTRYPFLTPVFSMDEATVFAVNFDLLQ